MILSWAPLPRCPVHGQMSLREGRWVCHGFDGEGCPHVLELDEADWQRIGELLTGGAQ